MSEREQRSQGVGGGSDKVKPALTPDEWGFPTGVVRDDLSLHGGGDLVIINDRESGAAIAIERHKDRHALAALCLHGFFTWEMVDELRFIVEWGEAGAQTCERLAEIADKLESLLPPREEA